MKVIDFLTAIWNWFNGSKTKVGALLLSIAALLPDGVMVLGYDLKGVLIAIGGFFGVVGVTHIVAKATITPEATA